MNHGSLFSGIGGPDLAAEWMGWENVFHCEWNTFGQKVLKYYWPQAKSYADITKTDFTIHRGRIDILTGGFPCQPYSVAGKRKGKDDERHLWPEMLRAIWEIQPRWVVGENVLGLVNWNGGLVFDEVQSDLEAQGYEVQPFILPACAKNAPHRRDRVWFVAYADNARTNYGSGINENGQKKNEGWKEQPQSKFGACSFNVTNPELQRPTPDTNREECHGRGNSTELERQKDGQIGERMERPASRHGQERITPNTHSGRQSGKEHRQTESGRIAEKSVPDNWQNFPTQSPVRYGNDGISSRLDGITFSKWRNESIKAGGNAIVPQVIFEIFKAIEQYEIEINGKQH